MRPQPPARLLSSALDADCPLHIRFMPADDLVTWFTETFIAEGAPLANDDHAHLRYASLGALWTNVGNSRSGRRIVGQAEMGRNVGGSTSGKWGKARAQQQVEEWFGCVPDFILTFDAQYAAGCTDIQWMALAEHELSHCGQERDEFGAPRFRQDGMPALCLRAHDVETFIGVAARYGAVEPGVRELMEALSRPPSIAPAEIDFACGTCSR